MNRNTKRFAFGIILAILLFTILMACSSLLFKSYMLLTVETDRPCDLTVFYDNGAEEGYCFDDAHLSQGDVLSAGKQTVKIYIPQEGLRRLRLDFGNAPCNIAIYQLEIVPNFTQSYRLSAEEVFHEFSVLNDISQSSCKDGVVDYAVSGTDGFIATQTDFIGGKQYKMQFQWQNIIRMLLISFALSFVVEAARKMKNAANNLLGKHQPLLEAIKRFFVSHRSFFFYELLVTLILAVCFGYIYSHNLKYIYIDIGADTFCSYWPLYLLFQDIFQGGGGFWSFRNGLGGSVLGAGQFADPFLAILFLFSPEKMADGLLFMTVIKYYVLSIFSYLYLKKFGFGGKPVYFGALSYTFCGFFVSWGQHYLFATAFIYLTVCLYAFERWAHEKKWALLVFSVAGLVLFYAYFAYIILLFLAIYVIFRYFALYRFEIRHFLRYCFSLLGYVLLGMGISAITLLPSIYQLTHAARVSGEQGLSLQLCTPFFYLSALLRFFSDTILGINDYFGAPGYLAGQQNLNFYEMAFFYTGSFTVMLMPLLLKKRACGKAAKTAMVTTLLSVIFVGVSGPVFNGFSTITTRWTMALVPLFCVSICRGAEILSEDIRLNCRYCLVSAAISCLLLLAVSLFGKYIFGEKLLPESRIYLFIPLLTVFLYLIVFAVGSLKEIGRTCVLTTLLVILTIDLGMNAFFSIVWNRGLMADPASIYFDGTQEALEWIETYDTDFYRVEKAYRQIDLSDSMAQGYNGEKSYSGTYGSNYDKFKEVYNLRYPNSNYLFGFDDKQALRNVSAGKYFLSRTCIERSGYVFLKQVGDIYIYQNLNALPLAYLQDQSCDLTDLSNFSLQERQNRLYTAFISEDEDLLAKYRSISPKKDTIEYTDVSFSKVQDASGHCTGIILEEPNTETLVLKLSFEDGALKNKEKVSHSITLNGENITPYALDTVFIVQKDPHSYSELEVEISTLGVQQIDWSDYAPYFPARIEVKKKDDGAVKLICENLRKRGIAIQSLTDSYIVGSIDADRAGMLVSSIPFDEGWTIFIDGEEAEPRTVNLIYLGVELSEGKHIIEFRFIPCGLRIGGAISIGSIAIFIVLAIWKWKKSVSFQEAKVVKLVECED